MHGTGFVSRSIPIRRVRSWQREGTEPTEMPNGKSSHTTNQG